MFIYDYYLGLDLMIYLISNNQTHRGIYYISETGGCKWFLNKNNRKQAHHSVFSQIILTESGAGSTQNDTNYVKRARKVKAPPIQCELSISTRTVFEHYDVGKNIKEKAQLG